MIRIANTSCSLVLACCVLLGVSRLDASDGQLDIVIPGLPSSTQLSDLNISFTRLIQSQGFKPRVYSEPHEKSANLRLVLQKPVETKRIIQLFESVDEWAEAAGIQIEERTFSYNGLFAPLETLHLARIIVSVPGSDHRSWSEPFLKLLESASSKRIDLQFQSNATDSSSVSLKIEAYAHAKHSQVAEAMAVAKDWATELGYRSPSISFAVIPQARISVDHAHHDQAGLGKADVQDLANQVAKQEALTFDISRPGKAEIALIRHEVARSFALKQDLLSAQIESLKSKIHALELQLQRRASEADGMIDRRVEQLLNPDYRWDEKRTLSSETTAAANTQQKKPSKDDELIFEIYKVSKPGSAKQVADVIATLLNSDEYSQARYSQANDIVAILGPPNIHAMTRRLIDALVNPQNQDSVPIGDGDSDRRLVVYVVPEENVAEAYNVVSTLLQGKNARLSADKKMGRLLLLANEEGHQLLKKALEELVPEQN